MITLAILLGYLGGLATWGVVGLARDIRPRRYRIAIPSTRTVHLDGWRR